ncbi:hypothetical protein ACQ9BO_00275 [Flavobacterium sp. P21]|uniref:hypothetical protein n=1 Tax=Flavobacterium sp. P21 TaxID=3423948 RepID=UPI003D677A6F
MKEINKSPLPYLGFDEEFNSYKVFFESIFKEKCENIIQKKNLENFTIECKLSNVNEPFIIKAEKEFCVIVLNFKQFPNEDDFVEVVSNVLNKAFSYD